MVEVLRWSQRSSTWPTATRAGQPLRFSSASPSRRGLSPAIGWVFPAGKTTSATAWRWRAAPTPYPTPGVPFVYFLAVPARRVASRDSGLREIEEALRIAERSGDEWRGLDRGYWVLRWSTVIRLRSATSGHGLLDGGRRRIRAEDTT